MYKKIKKINYANELLYDPKSSENAEFDSKQTVMRPRCPMQKSMSQQMENVMDWMKEGKFKHKKKD